MPARKPQPTASRARLTVLAAADDDAFLAYALELLRSKQRLDREAALEALAERPIADARGHLRTLYFELDSDGNKLDQGGAQRAAILRFLLAAGLPRDADIAIRASETTEIVFGDDVTCNLRSLGLRLLARIAPDELPYYAVELLDLSEDRPPRDDGEPAATAIRLLAATGHLTTLYYWLRGPVHGPPNSTNLIRAFEAFTSAPPEIVRRYVEREIATAVRRQDETLLTVFAEAVVELELEGAYDAIGSILAARTTDELCRYLAMLLAGTNRKPLLAILEEQLFHGRRPKLILEALRVRTTPEQQAIIDRWESR
jgi:hypothetical protein